MDLTKWANEHSAMSALLYAIPLFKGRAVVGGILLEAEPPPCPSKPVAAVPPRCSLATLQQLGMAAAVGLSVGAEEVAWLAAALLRVWSADGIQTLVELLGDLLTGLVGRCFALSPSIRTALMPHPQASTGLLFQSTSPGNDISATAAVVAAAVQAGLLPGWSGGSAAASGSATSGRGRGGAGVHGAQRTSDLAVPAPLGPTGGVCGITNSCTQPILVSEASKHNPSISAPTRSPAITLGPTHSDVVQLPPHITSLKAQAFLLKHTLLQAMAGAETAGQGRRGVIGAGSASGAAAMPPLQPFRGICLEDVSTFVHNVHNPSRDVCMLMGLAVDGSGGGPPSSAAARSHTGSGRGSVTARALLASGGGCSISSPRCTLQVGGSFLNQRPGSSAATNSGPTPSRGSGGHGLQSLVLLGLPLGGEVVLGLYLCFPRRLPGPLLEAVRARGHELLEQVLASPVRSRLAGPFATEFEALRTATPGSFAVLRSQTASGLQQHASASQAGMLAASAPCTAIVKSPLLGSYSREASFNASMARSFPTDAALAAWHNLPAGSSFGHNRPSDCADLRLCDCSGTATDHAPPDQTDTVAVLDLADLTANYLMEMGSSGDAAFNKAAFLAGGTAAASGGMGLSASVISITGVDAAASKRQAMELLMRSLQATLDEDGTDRDTTTNWEDLEEIELHEPLGKGGGGVVFRARLGTRDVAVKVMELPDVDLLDSLIGAAAPRAPVALLAKKQLQARKALLRNATELVVHGQISHPNLLQVYATYPNIVLVQQPRVDGAVVHCLLPADSSVLDPCKGAPMPTCCAIVMELADCGCLASALSSRAFPPPPPLQLSPTHAPHPEPQSVSSHGKQQLLAQQPPAVDMRAVYLVLLDVALALLHLHANYLVHRDLKPANLLLCSAPRDPRGFTVKLADLGFVMRLREAAEDGTRYGIADQACGTVTHMAPELLRAGAHGARVTADADVYSFGILMWELLAGGSRPFPHLPPEQISRMVVAGARPVFSEGVPLAYRSLAAACWAADPRVRPNSSDLVGLISHFLLNLE
ncbi:hypothetical protein GPECTOR_24g290 [Gonium pectorale]|uniref:Protein kinase domain-containing protein n=1 Tax=Gonium pectorale TaxID=33097 RepID=A0A150GI20_GONPE|nr:hypothetical protein GPECTOR_24g290 [Gonium pectorale]|eukprot:KXZ49000.1 hypothetical protein GPECTOR_24g290 [Gonium pectorale]